MRPLQSAFSSPLRCTVFLLNADPSLLTWLCTSLSPRWSFLALFHSRASSTSGTDSSVASPCCLELLTLSFSFSQARLLSARDLQRRTWRLRCICRGRHHCAWRLSCCLLEVGLRLVLDLAASHHLAHLCPSLHLWSHDSFLRNLDHLLKICFILLTRSLQGLSCGTRDANSAFFSMKSHAPCVTERQCLNPKAETQSYW